MLAEVAGLSTEAWTAIGTIAITVVGITTLVMNGRLGYHTKRSAEAAERAAVATRDAVSAQLATVGVDFKIEVWLTPEGDDFPTVVRVECDGATTWVHGVQIERLWVANQPSAANDVTCTPHDVSPCPPVCIAGKQSSRFGPTRLQCRLHGTAGGGRRRSYTASTGTVSKFRSRAGSAPGLRLKQQRGLIRCLTPALAQSQPRRARRP